MALLPPNMTDVLQVIDLVLNGPIKQHIRTIRAERIVAYFRELKAKLQADPRNPGLQKFDPPKATMKQGILDVIKLFETTFSQEKFAEGVRRSFENTGMIPSASGNWARYEKKSTVGTCKVEPRGSIDSSLFDMDTNPYIQHAIVEQAIDSYLDDNVDSEDENEQ